MVYIATGVDLSERSNGTAATYTLGDYDIDRMYRELFWEAEQRLIMHKLAKDYYGFR